MKSLAISTAVLILLAGPALAQGGHMGGNSSSSTAISGSSSQASNSGNHQSVTDKRQAPGFGLGGLTSDTCHGSWNGAVSTPWGGLGFGKTTGDEICRGVFLINAGWGKRGAPLMQQYILDNDAGIAASYKKIRAR